MVEEIKTMLESQQRDLNGFIKTAGGQLAELKTDLEYKENQLQHRMDGLEAILRKPIRSHGADDGREHKSIGGRLVESESLAEQLGRKGLWRRGELFREFVGGIWVQGKATITSGTVGTDVVQPQTRPGIIPLATQPLRVRDLMVSLPAEAPTIQYVKENSFTNAASPQVEASAKAESSIDFVLIDARVRTLAHWIPASKQILNDMPGLRAYVDSRLLYGLKVVEEQEILSGDNTGEHLHGIIPQATAYDTSLNAPGDTRIDTIRRAILQAELADEAVSGIVLNPRDVAAMDLLKDDEKNYVISTPTVAIQFTTLWGRPVVSSKSIAAGTFLVGAFGTAANIHDREDAVIEASSEHADFFTKNLVAIRCEERLALSVQRPAGFIYGLF